MGGRERGGEREGERGREGRRYGSEGASDGEGGRDGEGERGRERWREGREGRGVGWEEGGRKRGREREREREREAPTTLTRDRFATLAALLGKEITEALCTVRFLLSGRKLLSGQDLVTVSTGEALAVPRGRLVRDASLVDHLQPYDMFFT